MFHRLLLTVSALLALSGCATVVVDRSQGLGEAGKAYVASIRKVNDFALEKSLAFTADMLAVGPRDKAILDETNALMKKRVALVADAARYFDALDTYFDNLDALVKGDQSEATATAVGQLADSLKQEPVGLKISDERKKAITGLAGYVAKQFHAAAVEKALVRDADTIAKAIALSDQMLDEQIRWIKLRDDVVRSKAYIDEVQTPFLKPDVQLDTQWKTAWSGQMKTSPTVAVLVEAKTASKNMSELWVSVLRGKHSSAETLALLKQLKDGVDALNAVKQTK